MQVNTKVMIIIKQSNPIYLVNYIKKIYIQYKKFKYISNTKVI